MKPAGSSDGAARDIVLVDGGCECFGFAFSRTLPLSSSNDTHVRSEARYPASHAAAVMGRTRRHPARVRPLWRYGSCLAAWPPKVTRGATGRRLNWLKNKAECLGAPMQIFDHPLTVSGVVERRTRVDIFHSVTHG